MSDVSRGSVYRALDYVGFSCILVGVEEYGRSFAQVGQTMPWRARIGFILVGIVLLWLGEQGSTAYKSVREFFRAPADLKRALKRNAELEAKLQRPVPGMFDVLAKEQKLRGEIDELKKRLEAKAEPRLDEGHYIFRSENERLKIELKEQRAAADARTNLSVENTKLKHEISLLRVVSAGQNFPALQPAPAQGLLPKSEERIFVTEPPSFLLKFFDGHTGIQAKMLLEPYLKKWMEIKSVKIANVESSSTGYSINGNTSDGSGLFLRFGTEWADRITILRLGVEIDVIGRIAGVRFNFVSLEDCEISIPRR